MKITKLLKRTFFYKWFLFIRAKNYTNDKLLIQLTKRTHSLEKTYSTGNVEPLFIYELECVLDEIAKRDWGNDKNVGELVQSTSELILKSKFEGLELPEKKASVQTKTSDSEDTTIQTILNRRSVRSWKSEKISKEEIMEIIDIAKWSPNSCNRQLWKFLVLTTDEEKESLTLLTGQKFINNAPLIVVPLIKIEEYSKEEYHYAYLDTGAIIQNILLTAYTKDIGVCWLGIKNNENRTAKFKEFQAKYNLDDYIPTSILAMGHPDKPSFKPPRKDTDTLVIFKD